MRKDKAEYIVEQMEVNRRRRQAYIEQMRQEWLENGKALRKIREGLKISRREIAKTIGAAESVIARLETGGAIMRRPVIEQSYKMAMKLIQFERREAAGLI